MEIGFSAERSVERIHVLLPISVIALAIRSALLKIHCDRGDPDLYRMSASDIVLPKNMAHSSKSHI